MADSAPATACAYSAAGEPCGACTYSDYCITAGGKVGAAFLCCVSHRVAVD